MSFFERLKRFLGFKSNTKQIEAPHEIEDNRQSGRARLLGRILSKVPGTKETLAAKKDAIKKTQIYYTTLLVTIDSVNTPMKDKKVALEANADEVERILQKKESKEELTFEEMLIYRQIQDVTKTDGQVKFVTSLSLAARQGLFNVADPNKSKLIGEGLQKRYLNAEEFLRDQNAEKGIRLFRTLDKRLGDIPDVELRELMISPTKRMIKLNKKLQEVCGQDGPVKSYVDLLMKINKQTGFNTNTNPLVPLGFKEDPNAEGKYDIDLLESERKAELESEPIV